MRNKMKVIAFGVAMASLLYVGNYYASKDGEAASVAYCFANNKEGPPSDCPERAAAFKEKYGHAFDAD